MTLFDEIKKNWPLVLLQFFILPIIFVVCATFL